MSETAKAAATSPVVAAADVAPNRRRGGDIRVVLSPKTVGSTSGFMGTLTVRPGEYVAEHYHPYSEEFVFVVSGTLVARVEDVGVFEVAAGEGFMVPIGRRHRVWNDGDSDVRAVFYLGPLAPRPELGHVDTEELPVGGEAMSQPDVGAPRR
ncbi:cupin domain-containing protein [Micromonospora sp. DT47]|uniref:cupin domain-containing protein n=1 Tax=Micromonospora sp. DT47 TaxID=3393431 RepID=UPI003CF7772F